MVLNNGCSVHGIDSEWNILLDMRPRQSVLNFDEALQCLKQHTTYHCTYSILVTIIVYAGHRHAVVVVKEAHAQVHEHRVTSVG